MSISVLLCTCICACFTGYAFSWDTNYQRYSEVAYTHVYVHVCVCTFVVYIRHKRNHCIHLLWRVLQHRCIYVYECTVYSMYMCMYLHLSIISYTHVYVYECMSVAGSCITSDDTVTRDVHYDGHPIQERCTVITRIAPSFIRSSLHCEVYSVHTHTCMFSDLCTCIRNPGMLVVIPLLPLCYMYE